MTPSCDGVGALTGGDLGPLEHACAGQRWRTQSSRHAGRVAVHIEQPRCGHHRALHLVE
ncbi:MAG TPA: hypothetical protein VK923_01120 [Euzebyales bacterium]|nr:hypothetical protein [Euzebyales bacterium]